MTKASDNAFPSILITEGTEPSAPAAGKQRLYIDSTTHKLKRTDSSGTDVTIESGAPSGSITASGYTQTTARLLGRTTASTGAIEEITVGSGLSLSAGSLTATGGGGGALTFLEGHTASSSSSLDFTSFISSTYDDYMIEVVDLAPATNAVQIYIEIGTGGGPTYDTGNNYEWGRSGITTAGAGANDNGTTGTPRLFQNLSNNAAYGYGFASLRASNLQSTSHRKTIVGTLQYVSSDPVSVMATWGMQWTTSGTAVTALRFIASSGNIASGTIRIYGISKS